MGVLRIKESVDELLERDPYELFTIDEPHRIARRLRPEIFGAAFVGLLVAFGVALMTLLNVQHMDGIGGTSGAGGDTPFVYFEIKVIDPDGRPVAGAIVREGEQQLGVTDSFGEWRRFMRVKLGATKTFAIDKQAEGGALTAVKNIAVPTKLPATGDLEVAGSVQLARDVMESVPAKVAPAEPVEQRLTEESSQEQIVTAGAPTSIWFMIEGAGGGARQELTEVLQALRRRSRELGMRVDPASPLRIRLRDILVARQTPARPERRLIVLDARQVDGARDVRLFSYLRDYQETAIKTARDLLWAATVHMAVPHRVALVNGEWLLDEATPALWRLSPGKTLVGSAGAMHTVVQASHDATRLALAPAAAAPCDGAACLLSTPGARRATPVAGWQQQRLSVLGADEQTDIYVSGYEAWSLGGKEYAYWGAAGAGANVTAFRQGRLVLRGRVETGAGAASILSVPTLPLSRTR